ncbi:MAG: hypothetical protein RIR10_2045 [Planctomycetota bacterium]
MRGGRVLRSAARAMGRAIGCGAQPSASQMASRSAHDDATKNVKKIRAQNFFVELLPEIAMVARSVHTIAERQQQRLPAMGLAAERQDDHARGFAMANTRDARAHERGTATRAGRSE